MTALLLVAFLVLYCYAVHLLLGLFMAGTTLTVATAVFCVIAVWGAYEGLAE